jgi:hypothetical protein
MGFVYSKHYQHPFISPSLHPLLRCSSLFAFGVFFFLFSFLQLALLGSRIASAPSADNIDGDNWKLHLTLPNKNSQEPGFCNFPEQGSALSLLRVSLLAYQMKSPLHFETIHHFRHSVFVTACFLGKYVTEFFSVLNLSRSPVSFSSYHSFSS